MMKTRHISAFGIVLLFAAASCGRHSGDAETVLASVGKDCLTVSELRGQIPAGVSVDDSTRLARAYIRSWIDNRLVSQVAAREIDLTEIDRMTREYRNSLIMWEYGRRMFDAHASSTIPDDSLRAYYDANREEFRLQRPIVKGVYLKVPDDDKSLAALRRLYRSTKPADIDRLEKSELSRAVHYDYFRDRWIDWEQIENRIPYEFGDADMFLRSHRNLDISSGGFTYLLDISGVLPSGSVMPFESARPMIAERMKVLRRSAYEASLRQELFDHAISSGTLKVNVEI